MTTLADKKFVGKTSWNQKEWFSESDVREAVKEFRKLSRNIIRKSGNLKQETIDFLIDEVFGEWD